MLLKFSGLSDDEIFARGEFARNPDEPESTADGPPSRDDPKT